MMRMMRWFALGIVAVGLIGTAQDEISEQDPAVWRSGMYWTYHAEAYRRVSGKRVLWMVSEVTFLAVKSVELLGMETWAVAVVSRSDGYEAQLFLLPYTHGYLRHRRWPLPVEFIGGTGVPRGLSMLVATLGLPTWGVTTRLTTAGPSEFFEGEVEITHEGVSEVTVLAGTFDDAIVVRYEGYVMGQHREGVAWWAPQVGWWVRAEGRESNELGEALHYYVELRDWGMLTPEELISKLSEALNSTARRFPESAEVVRKLLENLQIMIPLP